MVTATNTLRQIAEESGSDPRGAILRLVGDLSDLPEAAPRRILAATYIRPEKTKGGIYRIDKSLAEDRYQAKVGLVLKVGGGAFVDDAINPFFSFRPEPGDWVQFRPSDGEEFFWVADNGRDGTPMRWFVDTHIIAKVKDPERIY